jgi:hypothetical protein
MNANPLGSRVSQASATSRVEAAGVAAGRPAVTAPNVQGDIAESLLRDRVRWGPIIAGVVAAIAVLLFLTILGIALGISALRGDNPQTWGTAAGIWGGLSLLVAFFAGGWMTSRSAMTLSEDDGPLNGFVTGAATLLVLLWFATTAAMGALGFFAATVAQIAGATAPSPVQAASQNAGPGAWGTAIAIILAVGAATLGGMIGRNPRLILPGQRTVVTAR